MYTHPPTRTHTGIGWWFQENAWADGEYSKMWMREFNNMLTDNELGAQHLLYLDDLSAQKIAEFNEIAMEGGVFPFPLPPGT